MHVLESGLTLSKSMLWRLQRTFYGDQGIDAWSRSGVPQTVTTTPLITSAYAGITQSFWRDVGSLVDPSQPLYIIELGAGSGRFAYRFLKALATLTDRRYVYVMTDASPTVIDYWLDNPRLRPFVEAGVLDFASFDVGASAPMVLQQSGATLAPGEVANPMVLLGNYIFDSIPQDAFEIRDGQLYETHVAITSSSPDLDLTAPDSKVRIGINFESAPHPIGGAPYGEAPFDDILRSYQERLGNTFVLMPKPAMECMRYINAVSGNRTLCLIGDFGDTREEELREHGPPGFGAGGGFWLAVNFHALGEFARRTGGRGHHPSHRHLVLNISMFLFGDQAFPEAEAAYSQRIDRRGPDDLSVMARGLMENLPRLTSNALLAMLRTIGWDTDYTSRAVPRIIDLLPETSETDRREFLLGMHTAWEQYYPIGGTEDVPFGLGAVLYTLEEYPLALELFQISLRDFGEDPRTTMNLALTYYRMHRLPDAVMWLERTLEIDPSNELARDMYADVQKDLAGPV